MISSTSNSFGGYDDYPLLSSTEEECPDLGCIISSTDDEHLPSQPLLTIQVPTHVFFQAIESSPSPEIALRVEQPSNIDEINQPSSHPAVEDVETEPSAKRHCTGFVCNPENPLIEPPEITGLIPHSQNLSEINGSDFTILPIAYGPSCSSNLRKPSGDKSSMKNALAVRGLTMLFSNKLPNLDGFSLTELQESYLRTLESNKSLIKIFSVRDSTILFEIDTLYDNIIYVYTTQRMKSGDVGAPSNPLESSKFRYWSDCSIEMLRPIKNAHTPKSLQAPTIRQLSLPTEFLRHPAVQNLFHHDQKELLSMISTVFAKSMEEFNMGVDLEALLAVQNSSRERSTRKRATTFSQTPISEIIKSKIAETIAAFPV